MAYDCNDPAVNLTAVSLRGISECPESPEEFEEKAVHLQIIQHDEIQQVHTYTCLIEVTRIISYCGMHSHSSMVDAGLATRIVKLGAEQCRATHRFDSLSLYGQTIVGLTRNGSTRTSATLSGKVGGDGSCSGNTYTDNGQTWDNVYVVAAINIQLMDFLAGVRTEENIINLKTGVTCPYLDGYCFDSMVGEAVWTIHASDKCEKELSMLYEGRANHIREKATGKMYVVVQEQAHTFALTLVKRTTVCYQEVWQTEHPRLMVQMQEDRTPYRIKARKSATNTDLTAYINSKFLYVEQAYKREDNLLYRDVLKRLCRMKREILENRLTMAQFAPDIVAQLVEKEGRVGRVLGEVLYIIQCVPKIVTLRRTNRCYKELPVNLNNKSLFMAPVTRILQVQAEEIDCNSIAPPLYWIEDQWIAINPHPAYHTAPKTLDATGDPRIEFAPIQPLGESGLYTQEEVMQVQRVLTFGAERRAVENILTRKMSGKDTDAQGYSALRFFDPEEMKTLAQSTIKQLYGWFSGIGTFISGLIGFYAVFKLIKYVVGVTINGMQIYKAAGCGFALLASVWNVLTFWLVQGHQQGVNRNVDKSEEMTEVRTGPASADGTSIYPKIETVAGVASAPTWLAASNMQNQQ